MNIKEAIQVIESFSEQALRGGLFSKFQDVDIIRTAINAIKKELEKDELKEE